MRAPSTVVFCDTDDLIPVSGRPLTGFPDFLEGLADSGIPCVWLTSRNRHELDPVIRSLGHVAPFIAEGGSAVYIPEDYFHLKPARTIRLGRFICIPVAAVQPAARDALASLAESTGVTVVPLRSLSHRELIQNSGLARDAAESIRLRDFDELFFFAGPSDEEIQRFRGEALRLDYSVRPCASFWSLAVRANLSSCVRELRGLFDRAMHTHAFSIGMATAEAAPNLFSACDRGILLTSRHAGSEIQLPLQCPAPKKLPLFAPDTWPRALETIQTRRFD